MITIVLVDDHEVVIEGLRATLASQQDLRVVHSAGSLAEARDALEAHQPDVCILDVRLPDGSGFDLVADLVGATDAPAFLMLSSYDMPQYLEAAMRLGAAGFMLKTAPTAEILAAIRRLARGGMAYDSGVVPGPHRRHWQPLTLREREVVERLLAGRSNDEIGVDLGISRKTVEGHLAKLFERVGVGTRTDLALRAERERWLDLPVRQESMTGARLPGARGR